jgi:hypothetical protein
VDANANTDTHPYADGHADPYTDGDADALPRRVALQIR